MAAVFKKFSDLSWTVTTTDIETETQLLMKETKQVYDFVGQLKPNELSRENIIKKLAEDDRISGTRSSKLDFVQHVFDDATLRQASVASSKILSEFDVEMSMRKDVFDNLVSFEKTNPSLNAEEKRYLEKLIRLGRRNGLHLSTEIQEKIKDLKKRQSDLSIEFNKNVNEDKTTLEFTPEELVGVATDFIEELEKTNNGKVKVTMQYPHYFPIMKKAQNPVTRRRMYDAFNSRCLKENTPILEELVRLRHEQASLLGFPTHAAYVLEMRMAKTPEAVDKFLQELLAKLQVLKRSELSKFLDYKKQECKELSLPFDNKLHMSDMRYYMNKVQEKEFFVDHELLKEYFPIEVVTKGLFEIYQELFGLTFNEVKDPPKWHADVKLFSVTDSSSGDVIGFFYTDLFPREGKFSHAAMFSLQAGCMKPDNSRQVAVAALVANFPKPTKDKPALFVHDDVETFFHEFGHVIHSICSKAQIPMFSGSRVERDFVEAPSQMLENWVWEGEALKRMSAHYKDKSPIPEDLLQSLIKSRVANAGVFNTRQIVLSLFDQTIHTSAKADTTATYNKICAELMEMSVSQETNMSASFGHLADGYDAQYYGYLWSEVFSADMFGHRFQKEGIMNAKTGMDYRKCILQPGGSLDAADMLRNFLKREPNQDAFLLSKGLK